MSDEYVPFVESNLSAGEETLRRTMNEQGYLFFRGIIPAKDLLAVRRDVLTCCAEEGWLDSSHDRMEAVVAPGMEPTTEGQAEYNKVYRRVLKQLPSFHELPEHPALKAVAAALLNTTSAGVLVHPRRIGRLTFPNNTAATTPAHQDHFYIRGSVDTYSCWVPLGECPKELGGLAIAPRTQNRGFLEHTEKFPAAVGGRGVPTDDITEWHTTDFGVGDALFFHSYTIHKALPNQTPDRLRLSTDNRYQRRDDTIDPGALRTHYDL